MVVPDLREYFNLDPPQDPPQFTGARFDTFNGGGAREDVKDIITASDILAVQCLSVLVPAPTALSLVEGELGRQLSAYLQKIPADLDLAEIGAASQLQPRSAADRAWHLLKQQDDVGWVIAGKILARKRPLLIPVWDSIVKCANGRPPNAWSWLAGLFAQEARLGERLNDLHKQAELPALVSRLRVLDVAIWMRHRREHSRASCPGMVLEQVTRLEHDAPGSGGTVSRSRRMRAEVSYQDRRAAWPGVG
jgi:hypothetical protein